MVAVHDVFIHLSKMTVHVIRLNGEHFAGCMRCAVCFQRPHFPSPETLTTELCLTTQRPLSNQAVRTGGTRVHLVVDQVVQFLCMREQLLPDARTVHQCGRRVRRI